MPYRVKTHSLPHIGKAIPDRRSANERGYNYRWQQASRAFKAANPFCVDCLKKGFYNAGSAAEPNHVDHRIPHRGNQDLFWDQSNWQTLCERHHNEKTGRGE